MAGTFEGMGSDLTNPGAEIAKGIARGWQDRNAKELLGELNTRETLAKRLEEIEKDRSYDPQAQEQARNYAIQLRMLKLTDKRPKEFLEDKALTKMGLSGIEATPAWFRVTMRKKARDGPQEPAQPAEPQQPADPSAQLQPPPNFDELMTAEGAGAGVGVSAGTGAPSNGLPPMPGGEHLGPNQITAAPAIAPPPSIGDFESARRSPQDLATEDAELSRIRNSVSLEPNASGMVDSRALPALGRQQTAAIQLRKLGLQPDGVTPVPPEQMTPAEQQKIAHLRAQDELLDAQEAFARARAAYEQQHDEFTERSLRIAEGALQVKQQNAQTAASRVAMEGAMYGSMLGSGGTGRAQGFLGGADMGINDPIDSFVEQVLTNQLEFTAIPAKLKPLVSLKIAQTGGVIVPEKLQGKLMQFTEAKEAVDTVQQAIQSYTSAEGTEAMWAAYNLNSKIDGLTRIVGRALGEKGVFTDADKADFRKLMSPGLLFTLSSPERASKWIEQVNGILNRVEQQQLQGFYQRVYARRDRTLDTLRPGDQKNVMGEFDGSGGFKPNPAYQAPAPVAPNASNTSNTAPPPIEQRVEGVTRAVIGGVPRIWKRTKKGVLAWVAE